MEVPGEVTAFIDQHVQKFIAGHVQIIFAGIADRNAEGDLIGFHQLHRPDRGIEMPFTAASVIGFLEALNADGDEEIPDAQQFFAEVIIDQRPVRESVKSYILMLFTQADNILFPHQRLTAGEKTGMDAELFAFRQHFVHHFEAQILFVTVFRCPASRAVHVAG